MDVNYLMRDESKSCRAFDFGLSSLQPITFGTRSLLLDHEIIRGLFAGSVNLILTCHLADRIRMNGVLPKRQKQHPPPKSNRRAIGPPRSAGKMLLRQREGLSNFIDRDDDDGQVRRCVAGLVSKRPPTRLCPPWEIRGVCFQCRIKASGTSIMKVFMSVEVGAAESVTTTLKLKLPAAVGTPEMRPDFGSSCSPGGKRARTVSHSPVVRSNTAVGFQFADGTAVQSGRFSGGCEASDNGLSCAKLLTATKIPSSPIFSEGTIRRGPVV